MVGNIGNPYTDVVLEQSEEAVTVAEISSFQLETIDTFHPCVSAITNITEDHLNRHHNHGGIYPCKGADCRESVRGGCLRAEL